MIRVGPTPSLGRRRASGNGRLGDYWLRESEPGVYRISDSDQDVALARPGALAPYRLSDTLPGTGTLVRAGGFFGIFG